MRSLTVAAAAVLLFAPFVAAQQQQEIQATRTVARPEQKKAAPRRPLSKQDEKLATDLLEGAESAAAAFQPATRILAYVELSRAYEMTDRAKAADVLEKAYDLSRGLELNTPNQRMNKQLVQQIQQRVLKALVALSPATADKMIDDLPVENRAPIIDALLSYYRDQHDLARPIDLVTQISQQAEMPYDTASKIMDLLGPDENDQLTELFTLSLSSYQNHKHQGGFSTQDFASMIPKFYGRVPDTLIHQGIDEVLAQAKKADEDSKQGSPTIGISSASGAAQFSSMYDYRIFQLMPVLRKLDPAEAKQLLEKSRDAQTFLSKYPNGMSSLNPPGQQGKPGGSMMMWSGGPGEKAPSTPPPGAKGAPPVMAPPSMGEEQRVQQIVEDSAKHPDDALASVPTLSPQVRVQAYLGIAQQSVKKDPSVAKSALGKALDALSDVPPQEEMMSMASIVSLYRHLHDTADARIAIAKGMDIAAQLYKTDTDADDPNTAPKAYWPSTNAWRTMLDSAAALSPEWATSLLKDIPDDDIRYYNQIAVAEGMIGVPRGEVQVVTIKKHDVNWMMSGPGPND